jgi:hypothetical protein
VSTLATAPERAGERDPASSAAAGAPSPRTNLILGTGLAAALVALAFLTSSSIDQTVTPAGTWSEIAVTILGVGACAVMIIAGRRARAWGAASVALFAAFTAFAALSIIWSVQPDWSWFGANQLLSCLAVFAGAAAMARTFPERWPAVVGGVGAAMAAVCAYSLLAKVFPASLAPTNTYGRLQAPFGYWNAVGVAAAMGVPACLWAAARREGSPLLRGVAVPAMTVLISVIALSYSRSAVLAVVLGGGLFLAFVPLRLRATLMLALGALGAVPLIVSGLGHQAFTTDALAPAAQDAGGHAFGWVLLIVVAVMTGVGVAAAIASDRVPVSLATRRRIGAVLLGGIALLPVLAVVALAASSRGLTGEISHAWHQLTSSTNTVSDTSGRITQLGSSRPLYWHQGLQVAGHNLLKGVGELGYGIARLQYTTNPAKSDQAHSYLVQTLADLGLIGLLTTLALLAAWVWAAVRALAGRTPWSGLRAGQSAERAGLFALAGVVVAFGIQSALDWTFYFPGVTIPALLAAGWLAGRGPLLEPVGRAVTRRPALERPGALALTVLLGATGLLAAWVMWQPLRSTQDMTAAEFATSNATAFADARAAADADPLSVEPLYQLAALYEGIKDDPSARAELVSATRRQPDNPAPWLWLAQFDLTAGHPGAAATEARRVLAIDHTPDLITKPARTTLAAAQAAAAQRTARARSRRRHRGHPPAPRTST